MDHQLPDRQAAASEAGKILIQHPWYQHWSSSGLCSLPTDLLPVHLNTPLSKKGETSCSPPTHHHEQHCDCSRFIQIPGHHNFSGPEVGQSHWVHCEKGPAEAVFSSPAVQPATGAAETVLLCHHWIRPLQFNNCLVQLSYQIWPQKTTEGSPDCWANHWYTPLHSPGTVLIQSEQKGW